MKHYIYDTNGVRISLPQKLRRIWIDEQAMFLQEKHMPIYIVCGEFSSTDTAEYALLKGYDVRVICGKHMFSESSREKVSYLKEKYGGKFSVSIYSLGEEQRPPYHSALIGQNVFFENKHIAKPGDKTSEYTVAKVIENIDEEVIDRYMSKFNEYLQDCEKRDVDAEYIRSMNILGSVEA